MEAHSNEDIVLSPSLLSDQSEIRAGSVAESALQDGEKGSKPNRSQNLAPGVTLTPGCFRFVLSPQWKR